MYLNFPTKKSFIVKKIFNLFRRKYNVIKKNIHLYNLSILDIIIKKYEYHRIIIEYI